MVSRSSHPASLPLGLRGRLGLLALLVAAASAGCGSGEAKGGGKGGPGAGGTGGPGGSGGPRKTPVEVIEVVRGPISEEATFVATLAPIERVELASKVGGRLTSMSARLGDETKKGAVLAVIEDTEMRYELAEAEAAGRVASAAVTRADVELADATKSLERATGLAAKGAIADRDLETAKTRHAGAEAALSQSRAEVDRAAARIATLRSAIGNTRVVAPFDAVVAKRHADPGAVVAPGTPIYSLVAKGGVLAVFSVPERALARLTPGKAVKVWVDAYAAKGFGYAGTIARVSPVVDAATRTITVEAELPNDGGDLRSGMFARVRLVLGEAADALLVPRKAIVRESGDGGGAAVFVLAGEKVRKVDVAVGLATDEVVEVIGELSPGDAVVVEGNAALSDGALVVVPGTASKKDGGKGAAKGTPESAPGAGAGTGKSATAAPAPSAGSARPGGAGT